MSLELDLMSDFWASDKAQLQTLRKKLAKKLLKLCYIEEYKYRQVWMKAWFSADCSNAEIWVQQYQMLHLFNFFDHFKVMLLEQLPDEKEFVEKYWTYLKLCCADSLKVECTRAHEAALPNLVESLRYAWQSRVVPEFQSFQIHYDVVLPKEEPAKRKTPVGPRQTKKTKKQ